MATKFMFRPGTRIKGLSAADAAAELERLRAEKGGLTPEGVVETATDPANPLHHAFEWDDSKAAHEHRLSQARGLIRAVVVVEEGKPSSPMYVHVRTEESREYHPTAVVAQSPTLYQAALNELINHLTAARKSVADLRRLRPEAERPAAVERVLAEADELVRSAA
jgi:hypothetical protein